MCLLVEFLCITDQQSIAWLEFACCIFLVKPKQLQDKKAILDHGVVIGHKAIAFLEIHALLLQLNYVLCKYT